MLVVDPRIITQRKRRLKRRRAIGIALRIVRACRELKIPTVAVHSTADAGALLFRVTAGSARGRVAVVAARLNPTWRQASVGGDVRSGHTLTSPDRADRFTLIDELRLNEISLVREGACPGTWVQLV